MPSKTGGKGKKKKVPSKAGGKGKKKDTSPGVVLPAMGEDGELDTGEVVLAKMDLLPLLPGMIAADSELPDFMIRTRPSKPQSAEQDQHTASNKTYYAVRFFPKGDYGWVSNDRIARLSPSHITAFLDNKVSEDTDKRLYALGKRRVINAYRMMQAADPDKWLESLGEKEDADDTKGTAKEAGSGDRSQPTGALDQLDTATPGRKRRRDQSPIRDPETSVPELIGPKSQTCYQVARLPPGSGRSDRRVVRTGLARRTGQRECERAEGEKPAAEAESEVEIEDELARKPQSYEDGEKANGSFTLHVLKRTAPPDTPLESPAFAPETEPKEENVSRGQNAADERAPKRPKVENVTYTIAERRMGEGTAARSRREPAREMAIERATEADNIFKSLEWFGEINVEYLAISLADDERVLRNDDNRLRERAAAFVVKWEAVLGGRKIED
ncbi:hypothetical protein C8F01DRAFT_1088587 [Mycena amicta]|nr:hypothetical protein C8F01DRAFT_1088587 [Mycena amicta]